MDIDSVKSYIKGLDSKIQTSIIDELTMIKDNSDYNLLSIREDNLNNKQGKCPNCGSLKYSKKKKKKSGVQRYLCKSCMRCFNSFTGTWIAKINKKELLVPYIKLMKEGLSLEKTRKDKLAMERLIFSKSVRFLLEPSQLESLAATTLES